MYTSSNNKAPLDSHLTPKIRVLLRTMVRKHPSGSEVFRSCRNKKMWEMVTHTHTHTSSIILKPFFHSSVWKSLQKVVTTKRVTSNAKKIQKGEGEGNLRSGKFKKSTNSESTPIEKSPIYQPGRRSKNNFVFKFSASVTLYANEVLYIRFEYEGSKPQLCLLSTPRDRINYCFRNNHKKLLWWILIHRDEGQYTESEVLLVEHVPNEELILSLISTRDALH